MTLQEFLIWIISGGGSGVIAYWLLERIGERVNIDAEIKRYLSLVLAGLVALGAYMAGIGIGYEPQPDTARAWVEAIFSVIAVAIGLSQAIHGALRLRNRDADR
jgi:hypothetical protein